MADKPTPGSAALRAGRGSRSTVTPDRPETSMFPVSSIILPSVPTSVHTLKSLQRKGNRRTPFGIMELSTPQKREAKMLQTKWADKAGTTDYVLSAWCRIPLDSPHGWGNFGLEGYDEEAIGHDYRSEAAAKRATTALLAEAQQAFSGCTVDYVKIVQRQWDEDFFEDREGELIRSAEQRDVRQRYGYPTDDGKVKWEEWADADS